MKFLFGEKSGKRQWLMRSISVLMIAVCLAVICLPTEVEAKKSSKASAPKSVKVKIVKQTKTTGTVDVSWKKVKGAKGYQVTLSVKKGKKYKTIRSVKTTKTKIRIKTKQKGKIYYQVKSYKKTKKGKFVYGKSSARKSFTLRTYKKNNKSNNKTDNKTNSSKPVTDQPAEDISSDQTSYAQLKQKCINEVLKYSYEIIPLTDTVCTMFYVKTDNPDPQSFYFLDENTEYSLTYGLGDIVKQAKIAQSVFEFGDVVYENVETMRVKGGYIFECPNTDGGDVSLYASAQSEGISVDTGKIYTLPRIYSKRDYLINKCVSPNNDFWSNMDAVLNELKRISYYTAPKTQGTVMQGDGFSYLMRSFYQDKGVELIDKHWVSGEHLTLIGRTYPFFLQSVAYPQLLRSVAIAIEPNVIVDSDTGVHYEYKYTLNGESRYYGGSGFGSGKSIPKDMLTYKYSFDGGTYDMSTTKSWAKLSEVVQHYIDIEVPDQYEGVEDMLTWKKVGTQLSPHGDYARINGCSEDDGFAYLFGAQAAMSDCWFDGRYFDAFEMFQKGATFSDPELSQKTIYLKDFKVPLPALGENEEYNCGSWWGYNIETQTMEGIAYFGYDEESDTWKAESFAYILKKDEDGNVIGFRDITDEAYFDALTITREEAEQMGLDRNTNKDPEKYLIYDGTAEPGTKVGY